MDKAERLEFIRERFAHLDECMATGVIPTGKQDVEDEMKLSDGFREYQRDRASRRKALTSDER